MALSWQGLTDDTRAHGYKVADYGTSKKTQKFNLVERKLAADFVVKYAVLNKGDIRRTDKPGALVKYLLVRDAELHFARYRPSDCSWRLYRP